MVQYKLTYFGVRGLGETIRQLFALAHVDFEDKRIDHAAWPALKSKTPFGQVPVLEIDGKEIAQSKAIYRFLGKKFGFAGANDWESAQIDAWADSLSDYTNELRPYFMVVAGFSQGDKDQLFKDVVVPARDKFLPLLNAQIQKNGSGFVVGNKISWVDLAVANHTETFVSFAPDFLAQYPEVAAHLKKVHAVPEISGWIAKRPVTPF